MTIQGGQTPTEPLVFPRTSLFLTHCLGQLEKEGVSLRRAAAQLGTSPSTLSRLATGVTSSSQMDILIDLLSLMASHGLDWERPLNAVMGHTVEAKYKKVLHCGVNEIIQEVLIGLKAIILATQYPIPKHKLKHLDDLVGETYANAITQEQDPVKRGELEKKLEVWRGRDTRLAKKVKPWAQDKDPIDHIPSGLEYKVTPKTQQPRKKLK